MRLAEKYKKEVIPKMKEIFKYKNDLAVPKIDKIVINVGVGRHSKDKDYIEAIKNSIAKITGQKPIKTFSKRSISSFKVRQGDVVGVKATIRGKRMFDFLEKLINIVFPRVRDFRGISERVVDKQGNLTVGFKEQLPFPEIKSGEVERIYGLEVSISTTAKNYKEGLELLRLFGFPFKKK